MNDAVKQWWLESLMPSLDALQLQAVVLALSAGWVVLARRGAEAWLRWLPPLVFSLLAISRAFSRLWIADDAFISFRYAANWARGLGPVWNAGERIEGYTNPLWMALAAVGEWLGLPAPYFMLALNLAAVCVLVSGVWWALRRAFPGAWPVTPAVLSLAAAVAEFGSSGLETLPAAACVTFAAFAVWNARWGLAGALVCIAALLRPDHALFFAPLGLAALAGGQWRAALRVAPAGVVFTAFWCLRWRWYGDFYPNTYYLKSASLPYWEQGAVYVQEFLAATRLWWPVLTVGPLLWWASRRWRGERTERHTPFFLFTLTSAALWMLYVARVGGDFMEFRFALTALPLIAVTVEAALLCLPAVPPTPRLAVVLCALLPLAQPEGLLPPMKKVAYLARESSYYTVRSLSPLVIDSSFFRRAIALRDANPPRVPVAVGTLGMVGYINLDLPIFDSFGKTNRDIAKRPVVTRGRPGHEKWATEDDFLKGGVVWTLDPPWFVQDKWHDFSMSTRITFPGGEGWFVRFDDETLAWAARFNSPASRDEVIRQFADPDFAAAHQPMRKLLFAGPR